MVVGATGSIGAVCARMIARAVREVALVSLEPDKLYELARLIREETPRAEVRVATAPDELIGDCDLVISATSAFGQRVLDISRCKPGAVICDVARPPDISHEESRLRPDVLVVESGEVLIPGELDIHYDIGLPPRVAYACLAETALLAMEGRFESFTLGRQLSVERVEEIRALFDRHGFRIAPLRSEGRALDEGDFAAKRALAADLGREPQRLAEVRQQAAASLAAMPARSKGVVANGRRSF
jgi:predicted amino acid dehydrogenase